MRIVYLTLFQKKGQEMLTISPISYQGTNIITRSQNKANQNKAYSIPFGEAKTEAMREVVEVAEDIKNAIEREVTKLLNSEKREEIQAAEDLMGLCNPYNDLDESIDWYRRSLKILEEKGFIKKKGKSIEFKTGVLETVELLREARFEKTHPAAVVKVPSVGANLSTTA